MKNDKLKSLDLSIIKNKPSIIISSKRALEDVTPMKWSDKVLSGQKKVVITK